MRSWLVFSVYYQLIHRGHNVLSACVLGLSLPCFRSVQFLITNDSQGKIATRLRYGGVFKDRFIAIPVKEKLKID